MSLWRKLNTLFKASAQEPLEQLVDANSIRIFEQELRDAEKAIARAKRELACVMAEKKRLERHNKTLKENLAIKEAQATEALAKQEEQLALEIAEVIAEDECLLKEQEKQFAYLSQQEKSLRKQLREVAQTIAHYHSELRLAKANQSAEIALSQLRGYSSGLTTHMSDMAESLNRIKKRQEHFQDFDQALAEVESECSGEQLDQKLRNAGIDTGKQDGHAVLERLRKKQAA